MKHYISLLMLLTGLLLGSCSLLDEGPLPECPVATQDFTLSFTVDASEMSRHTRADGEGHVEVDPEYRAFENGIDLEDIGVFVFARMANAPAADEKLICKVIRLGSSVTDDNFYVAGASGNYIVKIFMSKGEFEEKVGAKMNPDNPERVIFRILMISGATRQGGTGGLDKTQWSAITADTYAGVIGQMTGDKWNFSMGNIQKENQDLGNNVTDIYPGNRKYIPMFGTNKFEVSQYALVNSAPGREVFMGGVDMLRSVAKIRVVDNIQNKIGDYPKITGAYFYGCQKDLRVVPDGALTYENGTQVHTPNIANPSTEQHAFESFPYKLGIIPPAWTNIPETERKGDIFVGYAPEMATTHAGTQLPYFSITVALSKNDDGSEVTKTYEVPMTRPAADGMSAINFGDYVLRNHIYTLEVDRVNIDNLTLEVAVNEWKTLNFEYEY